MTVMFHDIHENDAVHTRRQRIAGTERDEVLYADDTICVSTDPKALNRLLHAIEVESEN